MANTIKPKRSYTATNTPSLAAGELAINATDGKIFLGNALGTGNVLVSSLALSDHTGTLGVSNGGTGLATLTANNVMLGNGTSTPTFVAPSTSGNLLTSNGTTWQSTAPAASAAVPTGSMMPYAGATAPTGYLLCDASAVSRATYADLFAVLSTTYGIGNGSTTFNLPDMRGRIPMGAGTGTGLNSSGTGLPSGTAQTARTRGAWLGEETHLLTTAELASHTHANTLSSSSTGAAGSHSHTFSKEVLTYRGSGGDRYDPYPGSVWQGSAGAGLTLSTAADHTHTAPTLTNASAGSDTRHAIIPPCVVLNYIIKT